MADDSSVERRASQPRIKTAVFVTLLLNAGVYVILIAIAKGGEWSTSDGSTNWGLTRVNGMYDGRRVTRTYDEYLDENCKDASWCSEIKTVKSTGLAVSAFIGLSFASVGFYALSTIFYVWPMSCKKYRWTTVLWAFMSILWTLLMFVMWADRGNKKISDFLQKLDSGSATLGWCFHLSWLAWLLVMASTVSGMYAYYHTAPKQQHSRLLDEGVTSV